MEYSLKDLEVIQRQEELFSLSFTSAEEIGKRLIEGALKYGPIVVRIRNEETDTVEYEHIMEGKTERNFMFIEKKRKTVLRTGHSSIYTGILRRSSDPDASLSQDDMLFAGGCMPVYRDSKLAYTVGISGLHEGKDQLLLLEMINGDYPKLEEYF